MSDEFDLPKLVKSLFFRVVATAVATAFTTLLGVYFILEMSIGTLNYRIDDVNGRIDALRRELQREIDYRIQASNINTEASNITKHTSIIRNLIDENRIKINNESNCKANPFYRKQLIVIDESSIPRVAAIQDCFNNEIYYNYKGSFYNENGRSFERTLLRMPLETGAFRSGFGWRRHPILKTKRLHKGVDWSAPRGTPIYAAGDGVIEEAKWWAGNGKYVRITHSNGYSTGYAHMSRFAKGLSKGMQVRQGQIIGFVGSTGLVTGPHLHYEITLNGRHVNPLRIYLSAKYKLEGREAVAFREFINRSDLDTVSIALAN